MYYGSGTTDRIASGWLVSGRWHMQREPGGRCVCTHQTAALWNDGTLGFLKRVAPKSAKIMS